MMWIAPGISFLGGWPLLLRLQWWGLLFDMGCVVPQPFAAGGNRSYLEYWAIIDDPRYQGILPGRARSCRQIDTILQKNKLLMPFSKISGTTLRPPNCGYEKEHNSRLFEHRCKCPCFNPPKTPQNKFFWCCHQIWLDCEQQSENSVLLWLESDWKLNTMDIMDFLIFLTSW
jgi:hypothetical protein